METFNNSLAPLSSLPNCVTQEEGHDFLTTLPCDIIGRILSLLPFELAAQTTLLSTQWYGLWNTTIKSVKDDNIAASIFSFIKLPPTRTSWTTLQLHYDIAKVVLATTVPVSLLLDFSCAKQDPRLFHWKLQLHSSTMFSSSSASFVKTLYLKSVNRLTSAMVSSLVSQLCCLESLKLVKCNDLISLDIDGGSMLLNLTVSDCAHLRSLCVSANKLQSFRYRGSLPLLRLNSLCLEDAMLDFRKGYGYHSFSILNFSTLLLPLLSSVESLTLGKWTFEVLICPRLVSTELGRFQFHVLRELWWIQSLVDNMEALLSFLKICPRLEQLFVTIDTQSYSNFLSTRIDSERFSSATKLRYLRVVTLEGFTSVEEEMLLAEQLRELVIEEPLIISRSPGNCLRSLVKVTSQDRKWSYKYVEVEPRPKHPHMYPYRYKISKQSSSHISI